MERDRARAVKAVTTTTVGDWQKALNRQTDRQGTYGFRSAVRMTYQQPEW